MTNATTIPIKAMTRRSILVGKLLFHEIYIKPKYRYECKHGIRPCPFVSCKYHLYLDVNPDTGSIKLNFPELEVSKMKESCVLDLADRDGITLEETGEAMNICRERVRQIERSGFSKMYEAIKEMVQ